MSPCLLLLLLPFSRPGPLSCPPQSTPAPPFLDACSQALSRFCLVSCRAYTGVRSAQASGAHRRGAAPAPWTAGVAGAARPEAGASTALAAAALTALVDVGRHAAAMTREVQPSWLTAVRAGAPTAPQLRHDSQAPPCRQELAA